MRAIVLSSLISSLLSALLATIAIGVLQSRPVRAQDAPGAVVGDSFVLMKDGVARATLTVDDLDPHAVQLVLHGGDDSDPKALNPQIILKVDAVSSSLILTGSGPQRPVAVLAAESVPSLGF